MENCGLYWLFGVFSIWTLVFNTSSCLNHSAESHYQRSQFSHGFEELILRAIFPEHEALRDMLCSECIAAAATLRTAYEDGLSVSLIEELAIIVCSDLHLFPHDVCDGMVKLEGERVLFIFNNTDYDLETCCGYMIGHCRHAELKNWTMEIPGNKPIPDDPEPDLPAANTIRVLHITDTHTDSEYDEGSAVNCDYPLCCRHKFGDPKPGDPVAGHWGSDDHCDIPIRTLEELIRQAADLHPDLVYVTGDYPAHNVWEQTQASNIEMFNVTLTLVQKYMPNTTVLSCLGNHEAAPVNSYVVPAAYDAGFNMDELYEASVDLWSPWLPEDTFDDVKNGGYFSYSPYPGFRVISMNINYCDRENFWLLFDNVDPADELKWLIKTLTAAEVAGEKVHILSHFSPGGGCDDSWNLIFTKLIARFESTIRAMFFGHRHTESVSVVYDPDKPLRPVGVGFTGPEGSCGEGHQPAFKMYTVDANHDKATWSVIDMQTYTMNMTLANKQNGTPEFLQRYTSEKAYGVNSLTAPSVDQLVLDMAADRELFAQYVRNRHNHFLEPPEMVTCPENPDCHKGELCSIVNTNKSIKDACERIEKIIDDGYEADIPF